MNRRHQQPPPAAVRIPADVDRKDRLLADLTARQLLILATVAACLYGAWAATRDRVPLEVFGAAAAPVAAAAVVVAIGRRDGLSLDRWLAAAARQRLARPRRIAAEARPNVPDWIAGDLAATTRADAAPRRVATGGSDLPVTGVHETGVVELADDGLAVLAVVAPVNFALRSPVEQEMLVATYGRYLHAVGGPTQILIRSYRLDLGARIERLHRQAAGLPPALAEAAQEHADFLAQVGGQSDLFTRQVLLVVREPDAAHAGGPGRRAAESRLLRRLDEASALLSPAGITLSPLDADKAAAVVAATSSPASQVADSSTLARPDAIITTDAGRTWLP